MARSLLLLLLTQLLPGAAAPDAAVGTPPPSVLVMPIEPLSGVHKDLAVQVTGVLVAEAGKLKGFHVQSFRELEGVLTQEQMKQAAGCDSVSCAAELAGALNTDQIVIGTLGKIGQSYLLTLSRVTAVEAQTAGRAVVKAPLKDEEALITDMPGTVKLLFGVPAQADAVTPVGDNKPPPTAKGPSVGQQLGDAFGSLVRTGSKLISAPKGGQMLKSDNGTQPYAWIPAGRATLGCPGKNTCARTDAPVHQGQSAGFWINRSEVTAKSFQQCVTAGNCVSKVTAKDKQALACNLVQKRLAHPMNCVTYVEAQKYCEWEGGRLPTSDEWEFAAKAGRPVMFPWGNDGITGARANTCDSQCPQYKKPRKKEPVVDDGFALTAPVGNYPQGSNTWGLQDMVGNVAEWSFSEDKTHQHELLGGGYSTAAASATTYARGKAAVGKWDPAVGFRCIRLTPRPSDGNEH